MDRVLADSVLLGTVRQANPKGNDFKHCWMQHARHCAVGGGANRGEEHTGLNPSGEGTSMFYGPYS